jgi:hypothetical protein
MGHNSNQNHAAEFTRGASFVILLFNLSAVVEDRGFHRWDRAQQCAAKREFLSARTIGQKAKLSDAHKAAGAGYAAESAG